MGYKLRKNSKTELFEVLEIETNQIVYTSYDYNLASIKYKFLNKGGGFEGFTPQFIIKKDSY